MWEPTRKGGFRRTRVAQVESAAQMRQRSVGRNHPRVLLKLAEPLGLPECPYVIRWRLETPLGSVRVHHWLASDDRRAVHDHPWWFLTFVVKGGYTDFNPERVDELKAPAVRFRSSFHQHTVHPWPGGCWTIVVTGRKKRDWGFWDWSWDKPKFIKANKWFLKYGHHPCD